MVFPGYLPRSGIAGSYGSSIFSFLKIISVSDMVAQMVKNLPAMQEFDSWFGKIPWRRE